MKAKTAFENACLRLMQATEKQGRGSRPPERPDIKAGSEVWTHWFDLMSQGTKDTRDAL